MVKLLSFVTDQAKKLEERRANLLRALIHYEAKIGGQIFGHIPEGRRREFFCLDEHTWVWHEEWNDAAGQRHAVTTRYHVRPSGILKSQNGHPYQLLTQEEKYNFFAAVEQYERRIIPELDRLLQTA